MKYPHNTIAGALFKMADGDSLPSCRSAEFAEILDALSQIVALPEARRSAVLASIGSQVVGIVNRRMMASAKSEKVVAALSGRLPPLH